MVASDKTFTLDEVAKHNSATDCWMAIGGKVYDVTDYISVHHGGPIIVKGCGIDASYLFENRPTAKLGMHPESAKIILKTKYIGELSK